MADNPTVAIRSATETGTAVIAAKDRGGVLYQRVAGEAAASAFNTGSQVSVPTTAGGTEILAANSDRMGLTFYLEGDAFISWGGTPDSSSYKLLAFTPFNMLTGVVYTGQIKALSASGTIIAHVAEW